MMLRRLLISLLLLMLVCGAMVAQTNKPPDSSLSITGQVQGDGKPLLGALVTLWQQPYGDPTEQNTVATGRTDSAGNYELKNVPTGNYLIRASMPGFVTGKENDFLGKLRYVTVVGSQSVGPFNFELVREGVIAGTVTDAAGTPLANIPITLKAEIIPDGSGPPKYAENIRTDDQGRYRIAGVPVGKYRVAAGHYPLVNGTFRGKLAYRRVFYPNAVDETAAKVFDIRTGAEVADVNFNLGEPARNFTVRAKIVDARTGTPVAGLGSLLTAYANGKVIGGRGPGDIKSNDRGEMVLTDIPPGNYVLVVPGTRGMFSKDEPQVPNYSGESGHFEVTDKDLDIEVRVTKAASVTGFVVIEGLAGQDLLARVPDIILSGFVETKPFTPSSMIRTTVRPDGAFLFTGLKAGHLKFFFSGVFGKPLPLVLMRTDRDGVKVDGLDLQLGDEITGVKLVLAYANSGVRGVVKLDDGSVPEGLIGMATVPGNVEGNRSVVNQNGEFILQNLVAGEYKLIINAHDAKDRHWMVEQKIRIDTDKVTEASMVLDAKVKPNPDATSKTYMRP